MLDIDCQGCKLSRNSLIFLPFYFWTSNGLFSLVTIHSGFLAYWPCRFSLLHCIATALFPKHTSYIPSSCLSRLCYSLHKCLDTHKLPPAKSASYLIMIFNMLSHIPLHFLGLSTKHKDKSTAQVQNCSFLLCEGPKADIARPKSGSEWPWGNVWTTCPAILGGNLALLLYLSSCSLAICSSPRAHLQSSFNCC